MYWISAPTTRRAISNFALSDNPRGSAATIRLCSRANRVWMEGSAIVGQVSVEGSCAQPLEPGRGAAEDVRGVDEARDCVQLLARRRRAGARRGGCAREVHAGKGVPEPFEPVARLEGDRRGLGRCLVSQSEVVIEELAPGPAPLRYTVLREQVLADVVEDAVADVPRRR